MLIPRWKSKLRGVFENFNFFLKKKIKNIVLDNTQNCLKKIFSKKKYTKTKIFPQLYFFVFSQILFLKTQKMLLKKGFLIPPHNRLLSRLECVGYIREFVFIQ